LRSLGAASQRAFAGAAKAPRAGAGGAALVGMQPQGRHDD
jgi:hypothetical protein